MTPPLTELRTPRLLLRRWQPGDRAPFAALNADPLVMRHFPATLSRAESDALVDRIEDGFVRDGFGLWAVEVVDGPPLIGFVGLALADFEAPVRGRWEIGWRLAADQWGRGYATEGATAALEAAFGPLGLDEVVSFTVPANAASLAVMRRIGLRRRPELDFDHPRLPLDSPLRRHVVHGARAGEWAPPRPADEGEVRTSQPVSRTPSR
jgi:ribosomal-protein-alanine N-acetyltransferase